MQLGAVSIPHADCDCAWRSGCIVVTPLDFCLPLNALLEHFTFIQGFQWKLLDTTAFLQINSVMQEYITMERETECTSMEWHHWQDWARARQEGRSIITAITHAMYCDPAIGKLGECQCCTPSWLMGCDLEDGWTCTPQSGGSRSAAVIFPVLSCCQKSHGQRIQENRREHKLCLYMVHLHLHFICLTDTILQSHIHIWKKSQTVPGAVGVKGLAQGPTIK